MSRPLSHQARFWQFVSQHRIRIIREGHALNRMFAVLSTGSPILLWEGRSPAWRQCLLHLRCRTGGGLAV